MTNDLIEARRYAPVLDRMLDICASDDRIKFIDALSQSIEELSATVPAEWQSRILLTAIHIFTTGKIPGAVEA